MEMPISLIENAEIDVKERQNLEMVLRTIDEKFKKNDVLIEKLFLALSELFKDY